MSGILNDPPHRSSLARNTLPASVAFTTTATVINGYLLRSPELFQGIEDAVDSIQKCVSWSKPEIDESTAAATTKFF